MIVILTGAGISKESGLDTFRDAGGLWTKVRLEDVATPGACARNPQMVHDFYNSRRRELTGGAVQPNAAQLDLARAGAEPATPPLLLIQNVAELRQRAGTQALPHMR